MELRHLRYFIAVAEELSFTRAAARLQIAQPPLSQQIAKLETEIGVRLLDRTSRSVRLTPAGLALLHEARRLLTRADEVQRIAQSGGTYSCGTLRIGCVASGFSGALLRLLPAFRTRHPGVLPLVYEMEAAPQCHALVRGDIDIGFARINHQIPDVEITPILDEPLMAALPAAHPLAEQQRVPLARLAGEAFVMFPRNAAPDAFDAITSACAAVGFSPDIALEATNDHALVSMVACGLGISIVPGSTSNMTLPGIVYRPLAEPVPKTVMAIALPAVDPTVQALQMLRLAQDLYIGSLPKPKPPAPATRRQQTLPGQ